MKQQSLSVATFAAILIVVGLTIGCARTSEDPVLLSSSQNANTLGGSADPVEVAVDPNAQTVRIGEIDWYVDYEDAMAAAQASNRPVWLHFGENPG